MRTVGQTYELIAQREFEHLDFEDVFERGFFFFGNLFVRLSARCGRDAFFCGGASCCGFFARGGGQDEFPFFKFVQCVSECGKNKPDESHRKGRKTGNGGKHEHDETDDHHDAGIPHHLLDTSLGKVASFVIGSARNHDTGCGRDNEGRDLSHQTVPDCENRIGLGTGSHIQIKLENPDQKTADDIDHRDDDPRNGIPFDELARTVHRPVEIRILQNLGTAAFGLGFVNQTAVKVGIDRHLFSGHRIEGKAGRNFGNAA